MRPSISRTGTWASDSFCVMVRFSSSITLSVTRRLFSILALSVS